MRIPAIRAAIRAPRSRTPELFLDVRHLRGAGALGTVVADVSFRLQAGEMQLIAGRNGAGKSTLLRLLAGLLPAGGGEARLNGRPLALASTRRELGYLPQQAGDLRLFPATVEEVLNASQTRGAAQRDEPDWADALGLKPLRRRPAARLSGGELQRLRIARLLVSGRPLLFLDEPESSLDSFFVGRLREVLAEARRRGRMIVMITHEPALWEGPGVRRALLEQGRLVEG
ncbi:MAG: ATP-binding cassette domain-containing protein [Bacillota bacterium]|nr:ATP-binding cassette domain-containing protein [Bacillota bacterium]